MPTFDRSEIVRDSAVRFFFPPGVSNAMGRILVIDKDHLFAARVAASLRAAGHRPETVDSGVAALLSLAAGKPFDLIVTDLLAPELDGFDIIVAAREAFPHVPVIALYRPDECVDFDQSAIAAAVGATHTLPKPIEPAAVAELALSLLGSASVACAGK